MNTVITDIAQVTPDWLTTTLQNAGALPHGQVTAIHNRSQDTITAKAFPLTVDYSADASPSAPRSLFLKLGTRKPEVDFYNFILPHTQKVSTVRCYSAAFSDDLGQSHLLMDDISQTHVEPPEALPLPLNTCKDLIDILAHLHAGWWENPRLHTDLVPVLDDVTGFIFGQAQTNFAHFVDTLGDRLSDQRRHSYERILSTWPLPAWQDRFANHHAVTLVHGDTHWWNFLFPRESGPTCLIDWAVWHLNIGVSDIAYSIGQLCYREWRARFERLLVQHYHNRLLEYGVQNYDWEQCWQDYRLTMVFHTLWPIFHHQWAPNSIWWRNLECSLSAYEDLGCEELLQ